MKNKETIPKDANRTKLAHEFVVGNQHGIHARPAALLVKTACQYASEITLQNKDMTVSAKSIIGVLTLEGHYGVTLKVVACGDDASAALDAIQELFEKNFNEH